MVDSLLARRAAVVPAGLPQITPLVISEARGAELIDSDGARFIDLATGIGVTGLGHSHPSIIAAVEAQLRRYQHLCIHVSTYEPYIALCERLAALLPHAREGREESTKVLLLNSGAEAVENAIKVARQATGRPAVLCYTGGFHGRTMMGMTLTSKTGTKVGCGPFAPEVYRLPYPHPYHLGRGLSPEAFAAQELRRLEDAFVETVPASHIAAVILEVVQGEGGFVPCPPEYLRGLRELCDAHGILLIFDEVQSGFGRTGRWAAYEHAGVIPDLSTWAKALGGGFPIAALMGRASVMDAAAAGTIGGTFGGNPVSCAAALATLEVMEQGELNARATRIGASIRARLDELAAGCPLIGDVRGLGAMIGIELVRDADPGQPAVDEAREVLSRCLARGLLLIPAGPRGNVIRLLPPLTITDETLAQAMDILTEELAAVAAQGARS